MTPREWGLFELAILSLAILLGWFDWPVPEQTWERRAFTSHDNGAVVGCHLLWPSGFV